MITSPSFVSNQEYGSRLGDVGFWWPYVSEILKRHNLVDAGRESVATKHSSLPPHLIAQIDDYLARLRPFDRVFLHGDEMFRHVFVENGRLAGIIDWGDAMVTDRHYEFAKLHLDLFDNEKALLRAFLEASDWSVAKDFAKRQWVLPSTRQAHGLAQHQRMDVFYKLPALVPLQDIGTLDEIASELFAV